MPVSINKILSKYVKSYFNQSSNHFERQESICRFVAHIQCSDNTDYSDFRYSLLDSHYKAIFISRFGLENAISNGLNMQKFSESVMAANISSNLHYEPNAADKSIEPSAMFAADVVQFLIAYHKSFEARSSIKKAHDFFQEFMFDGQSNSYDVVWRLFNGWWSVHKPISFYIFASSAMDNVMDIEIVHEDFFEKIHLLSSDISIFKEFLCKSKYVLEKLVAITDRRVTDNFSFPELPNGFASIEVVVAPLPPEGVAHMKKYTSTRSE